MKDIDLSKFTPEEIANLRVLVNSQDLYQVIAGLLSAAQLTHYKEISVAFRMLANDNDCGYKGTPFTALEETLVAIGYPEVAAVWEKFKDALPEDVKETATTASIPSFVGTFMAPGPKMVQ